MIQKANDPKKPNNDPKNQMIQKSNGLKQDTADNFNTDILCL